MLRRGSTSAGPARAILLVFAAVSLLSAAPAGADHPQPNPDISKMDYTPIGHYGSAAAGGKQAQIPTPGPAPETGPNPSGKYVAYDTNVWESLALPGRHPGDESADDPLGTGDPRPGFCPPNDPLYLPWGRCANHQLEYLDYYERTMKEMLADFGVSVQRYKFESPGSGTPGAFLSAGAGTAYNISATVPGADHPEQTVVVGAHYDVTDSAPAPAWDSSEGHATVIRMAKIMSDYWRATGTRPSATIKFVPWDSEESGAFGSADFVENVIPPDEENKVRGYFNVDPCAGAYPAYRNGNPTNRIPEVLQLANPEAFSAEDPQQKPKRERIEKFNERALTVVDDVLDHLDDKLYDTPGQPTIFISDAEAEAGEGESQRDEIQTAVGGLAAFSSDYANFEALGIPVFNLFPDTFGPHDDGTPGSPEGVGTLHTPRDNLNTLNAFTSPDQTGQTASEGWAKGMEMCAHMESWYMLQPQMTGAQTRTAEPVAYYEALPNEAIRRQPVKFDASGTYQYSDADARALVDDAKLTYTWDFGDGQTASGRTVEHPYQDVGKFDSKLTVRNTETGQTDTMTLPITVVGPNFVAPTLNPAPEEDKDGNFALNWEFNGDREGFRDFAVEEASDYDVLLSDGAEGDLDEKWTAGETEAPFQPWQRSDSPQPKTLGNKVHSGEASYWTGAFPSAAPIGTGKRSTLTLKTPIQIPASGDPELSYWSLFAGEVDDEGRVEVAVVDDRPESQLEFQQVDKVSGVFAPDEPEAAVGELEPRTVYLPKYRGKRILLRFSYEFGPEEGNRTQPAGWYVDDIEVASGSWSAIGRTAEKTFEVFGKPKGTYAYRVKGTYTDGLETAGSNVERVAVTEGQPVPPPTPPPATGGPGARCTPAPRGFRSVRVRATRGGVKFRVRRAAKRRFRVVVRQHSAGRSVFPSGRRVAFLARRSKTFTWRPKRRLRSGYYSATASMRVKGKGWDVRRFALRRSDGRFKRRAPFARRRGCRNLRYARLSGPAFGGRQNRPLGITFRLNRAAQVSLLVRRGKRTIRRHLAVQRLPRTTYRLRVPAAGVRRGDVSVRIVVARGASTKRLTLRARRI